MRLDRNLQSPHQRVVELRRVDRRLHDVGTAFAQLVQRADLVANHTPSVLIDLEATADQRRSIVVEKVRSSKSKVFGYNAQADEYEDLVAAGVMDPTKVTRTALQNAASIAGLLLTTECVVVEKKEKEKAPPMPGGGGMGGMY